MLKTAAYVKKCALLLLFPRWKSRDPSSLPHKQLCGCDEKDRWLHRSVCKFDIYFLIISTILKRSPEVAK